MKGQLSVFDVHPEGPEFTCGYSFQRYEGQRVKITSKAHTWYGIEGTITSMGRYYTYIHDDQGRCFAVTPYDISPLEVSDETQEARS